MEIAANSLVANSISTCTTWPLPRCQFLDVYITNEKAIRVYAEYGFVTISPEPSLTPQEGGKTYIVMPSGFRLLRSLIRDVRSQFPLYDRYCYRL